MENKQESDVYRLFKQFKLGNCLFRDRYVIPQERIDRSFFTEEDIKTIATKEITIRLSENIMSNHKSAIKFDPETKTISCDLMVIKLEEFKLIIEAAIQMVPMESILMIKNGIINTIQK